ncbi:MAG TPA: polysaccharide deacetylase family protein [Gaiellaceae bacterium]|nr:polysaccharide deacetylase family protein [Gaiellaceae bacterium]
MLSTGPALIERQVTSLLRSGYRPASAAEVAAHPKERLLHVTFDDAYRSVVDAVDVLERLGVPSSVYVCSDFATGRPIPVPELAGEAMALPEQLETMTWGELRELALRGVEIGSHTVSHPHLPTLTRAEIRRELVESRRRIEDELGRPCRALAYPYGEHDARCREEARVAGYDLALAVPRFRAAAAELRFDPFAIPRVGLFRNSSRVRTVLKASLLTRRLAAIGTGPSLAVEPAPA